MLHDISVIGIGACGNKIVEKCAEKEFNTIAVNSTKIDTQVLEKTQNIVYIGDAGAGKVHKNGQKLVKKEAQTYVPRLAELVGESDVIVVAAALGGGSGSGGLAITIDLLRSYLKQSGSTGIKFIAVGVLPCLGDDVRSLSNTLEACKELNSIGVPYMLVDNDSVDNITNRYNLINESILTDIQVIRGDFNNTTVLDNMDTKDSDRLFSCQGLLTINKISGFKSTTLDNCSFDDLILKSIKESYNVQLQKDKKIKRMGLIVSATEDMLKEFDRNIPLVKEEIGIPEDVFFHFNVVEKESECSLITILSGLSMPDDHLEEMVETINEAKEASKSVQSNVDNLVKSTDWLDDDEDDDEEDESLEDVLNKW